MKGTLKLFLSMKWSFFAYSLKCVILFQLIFPSLTSRAQRNVPFYEYCKNLPTDTLVNMGREYLHDRNMYDSALVCYTLVVNRYGDSMDKKSANDCIDAYIGEWYIHFFHFYNFSKALECLLMAENHAEKTGLIRPDIHTDMGCTYQTIAEESNDTTFFHKALVCYDNAVEQSFETNDIANLNITMTNLITTAHILNRMDVLKKWWHKYIVCDMGSFKRLADYNKLLYAAMENVENKQYADAVELLRQQKELCHGDNTFTRYQTLAGLNIGLVYIKAGQPGKAIEVLKESEQMSQKYNFKDAKLEIYKALSECYRMLNLQSEYIGYREKYFDIKDTLLNFHQIKSVSKIGFLNDLDDMGKELTMMKYRHKMLNTLLTIFAVMFMIVLCMGIVVYIKNRQLNKQNRILYKKNLEMLEQDDKERITRRKLEETLAAENRYEEKSCGNDNGQVTDNGLPKKTQDNDNTDEIYDKIQAVMETSKAIFQPDFNAEMLAELVGVKQRYVSQTIRIKTGSNFYSLLSNYRIKEVCKRFRDESNYANLTIEAIAHSVGFKSRSNFCSTFKNIVGLSPSEYIKMAKSGI